MANPKAPDLDLGMKRDTDEMPEVNDPGYQLNVYRGNGKPKVPPKKQKDMMAKSPKAAAMRRRIDLATKDE